jgi:hypothetical protein
LSNYVKTTDFAAKDALPSGNPSKIAQGTQVDTEFNNIATAVATKEDISNKGVANGYASLDSSGDVPDAQISSNFPRLNQSNTFTNSGIQIELESIGPQLLFDETDAAANERQWRWLSLAGAHKLTTYTDAGVLGASPITVDRTGTTVDSIALAATTVTVNGQDVRNTAILNAGTLADARVAQSNVTQHQAALTILETQITDGSLLARLAANETVSGGWTFTSNPVISNSSPALVVVETGVAAQNTTWGFQVQAEQFLGKLWSDDLSTNANWLLVNRTANTVDSILLSSTALTWNGNTLFTSANDGTGSGLDADLLDGSHASAFAAASHNHSASELTSGTLADARVAQSNVTQHQAALSIGASQVDTSINTQTGSFSVISTMNEAFVVCNAAGTITVTVGTNCLGNDGGAAVFIRRGTGAVTFAAGGGVTINSPGSGLSITQQHGKAALIQITSGLYELSGNI